MRPTFMGISSISADGQFIAHHVNEGQTCRVVLFDITQDPNILHCNKIDGDTLPAKSTRTAYSVQIVFTRSTVRVSEAITSTRAWHTASRS